MAVRILNPQASVEGVVAYLHKLNEEDPDYIRRFQNLVYHIVPQKARQTADAKTAAGIAFVGKLPMPPFRRHLHADVDATVDFQKNDDNTRNKSAGTPPNVSLRTTWPE